MRLLSSDHVNPIPSGLHRSQLVIGPLLLEGGYPSCMKQKGELQGDNAVIPHGDAKPR